MINRQLGIRQGVVPETRKIGELLLKNAIPSIVFARSRLQVEVLTRYMKAHVRDPFGFSGRVRGYRGGYLPSERRAIERGLRAGEIDMVISTNALELGIDIGSLTACVLCGYPGTVASTWQQAGRAGRRQDTALTILVASSASIDQYIITHPGISSPAPGHALLQPNNLYILLSLSMLRLRASFGENELFGDVATPAISGVLAENHLAPCGGQVLLERGGLPRAKSACARGGGELHHHRYLTRPSPGHRGDGPVHGAHAAARKRHLFSPAVPGGKAGL